MFEGVSDGSLARAAALAADVRVDEGQWLVREGDAAAFYVLLSGTYDLMKRYGDGQRTHRGARDARRVPRRAAAVLGTTFFAGAPRDDAVARGALRPRPVRHCSCASRRS